MIGKRLLLAIGYCLLLQLIPTSILAASSSECGGPEGGVIFSIAIDPQNPATVYAGAYAGGLYKSTNGGATWSRASNGLTEPSIFALAVDPQNSANVFAAADSRVFKSTDGGASWNPIVNNGAASSPASALVIDPQNPAIVYAGGAFNGVFKSTDGGMNWMAVNNGLPAASARILAINPQSPATLYAAGAGVFKSTDGGASWSPANNGLSDVIVQAISVDPQNPDTLYIGTSASGVFKSTDGGASWSPAKSGLANQNIQALAIDRQHPATVYAGTFLSGIYKSTDGGATWNNVNGALAGAILQALAIDPRNTANLFAATAIGVFKSTNAGTDWTAANKGLAATIIRSLATDSQNPAILYAGTATAGVYKSVNRCAGWTASGLANKEILSLAIDSKNPSVVYAAGSSGISKSTNGGNDWSVINTGLANTAVLVVAIDPQISNTLYAGTNSSGVFRSTNGGSTWNHANVGLGDTWVQALVIDPQSPATIYAGTHSGVYKSTNSGTSWNPTKNGLPDAEVSVLAIDPQNSATLYAGTPSGIYKTTNGGTAWNPSGLENMSVRALTIDAQSPATLYAATTYGIPRIFSSTNGAQTWFASEIGLAGGYVTILATDPIAPQRVYAGTFGAGVWTIDLSDCSSLGLTLASGGAARCHTAGDDGEIRVGYATLAVNSGSTPYGTAVFAFKQNGVTVTEAGVPASTPTTRARIFIEYRNDVNAIPARSSSGTIDISTGIALVNNSSTTANVTYTLRDLNGVTVAVGHGTMAAGEHFAKFIGQVKDIASDFNLPSDFQFGSLEIAGDQPISVLALRGTMNQRNEFLMTTIPVADLTQSLSYDPTYFPQLADGGGYTSSLLLLNTSNRTENGTLQILDNNGAPLVVNQVSGTADSSFRYSIPAGGAFRFQTDGIPTSTRAGWVKLLPDMFSPTPVGSGVFSYNPGTVMISESGIPATNATTHARVYVDLSGNHNTGLAIANVDTAAANITIRAYRTDGTTSVGTSQGLLPLASGGHDAKFADQLISDLPPGFTGVMDISSMTPFAALTLRSLTNERNDFLMTTFPVADANQTAPSPIVFPQIVDGGGYITEFILISSGQAASTTLKFYDEDGMLADFGAPGNANVCYSNFGPSMAFDTDPTHAYTINGYLGPDIGRQAISNSFIPASTCKFLDARVPLASFSGLPNFSIFLQEDEHGLPGAVIEKIDVTLSGRMAIVVAASTVQPTLYAKIRYWLTVVAGGPSVVGSWMWNSIGDNAPSAGTQGGSPSGPWAIGSDGRPRSAFRVDRVPQ